MSLYSTPSALIKSSGLDFSSSSLHSSGWFWESTSSRSLQLSLHLMSPLNIDEKLDLKLFVIELPRLNSRGILTAISETFIKLTYCHLALLSSLIPKQF